MLQDIIQSRLKAKGWENLDIENITPQTAKKLAAIFNNSIEFWLNLTKCKACIKETKHPLYGDLCEDCWARNQARYHGKSQRARVL